MRTKFAALEADMNAAVFERATEIRGLLAALLSARHVYLLGEPGIAKSLLVTELLRRLLGATMFQTLMARTSLPEQLFGPVDLAALQAGKYRRVPTGKLQEAHVAFLDEIFKSNSAVLNSLLGVLNERNYDDGGNPVKVPLLTCVAASNELPQGEDLNALFDRLHLRFVVHRLAEDANVVKLLTMNDLSPINASITLDDRNKATKEVRAVKVNPVALDNFKAIRVGCEALGIRVSDRRLREIVPIAQAEAWLNGHDEIQPGDMSILKNALWSTPEERKKVIDVIYAIACPAMPRALEILDLAADQRKLARQDPKQQADAFSALRELSKEIEKLAVANGGNATPELVETVKKVAAMRKEVGELVLG